LEVRHATAEIRPPPKFPVVTTIAHRSGREREHDYAPAPGGVDREGELPPAVAEIADR
jgi:hypothetical protein